MTMRELARLANVSVSTVSKAFHDADDISSETKRHVFETAKQYGCYGKFYKGKFHKQIIAIICPEIVSSFYTDYVDRLRKIIEKNNGIAVISTDSFEKEVQFELLEYYCSYLQVDGVFVFGTIKEMKKGFEVPVVSIASSSGALDSVSVDIKTPAVEAISLLRGLGHENIAFISERLTTKKAEMFCDLLHLPYNSEMVIESQYRFEKAGEEGVRLLLERGIACTAILCAYDDIAIGAIRKLKKCGYTVPDDYSVMGINNIGVTEYMETPLTSIDTNADEVCAAAWELMKKKQKNRYYTNKNITITGKLVKRETVAKRK